MLNRGGVTAIEELGLPIQTVWGLLVHEHYSQHYVFRYVSAIPADRFHSSLCVNFHQGHWAAYLLQPNSGSQKSHKADTQDFYFWRMPEHDAAIQLISV